MQIKCECAYCMTFLKVWMLLQEEAEIKHLWPLLHQLVFTSVAFAAAAAGLQMKDGGM